MSSSASHFKKGQHVYYHAPNGDTVPAIVLDVLTRVFIQGNFPEGDRRVWVNRNKLTPQEET